MNPTYTISTALWISIPLITVLLFLPLAAAAGVNAPVPWEQWNDGQFSVIAQCVSPVEVTLSAKHDPDLRVRHVGILVEMASSPASSVSQLRLGDGDCTSLKC